MKLLLLISSLVFLFSCTKTPGTTEPPVIKDTAILWGSSIWNIPGETNAQAYVRVKQAFGTHEIVRVFCSAAPEWPAWLPKETVAQISFKYNATEVLNGSKDEELRKFFTGLGITTKIYWTYFHEPEDDIKEGAFTAEEYRNAFDHIIHIQKTLDKPNLVPTLCLMSYTLDPLSNRNWKDYLPAKVALISWDGYYSDNMGTDVSKIFNDVRAVMKQINLPWAIAETGVNKMKKKGQVNEPIDVEMRKQLLTALAKDISSTKPLPVFAAYFDAAPSNDAAYSDWRISNDPAMVAAWNAGKLR